MFLEFSFFILIRYVNCFQVKYNSYCYTQLYNYRKNLCLNLLVANLILLWAVIQVSLGP